MKAFNHANPDFKKPGIYKLCNAKQRDRIVSRNILYLWQWPKKKKEREGNKNIANRKKLVPLARNVKESITKETIEFEGKAV